MSDVMWNPEAFELAERRLKTEPAQLTAADVAQLEIFDPALAERALRLRSKALQPPPAPVPAAPLDVEAVAAAVIDVIGRAIRPLIARIEALEQRPALKFGGPFRDGTHYLAGSIVQKQGLWLAESDTHAQPGGENSGWKLILKAAPK